MLAPCRDSGKKYCRTHLSTRKAANGNNHLGDGKCDTWNIWHRRRRCQAGIGDTSRNELEEFATGKSDGLLEAGFSRLSYRLWKFFWVGTGVLHHKGQKLFQPPTPLQRAAPGHSRNGTGLEGAKPGYPDGETVCSTPATMTTTPDSKGRDTRPKKRKRDSVEAERQAKNAQKRVRKQKAEANGLLGSPPPSVIPDSTAQDVETEASALQPVGRSEEPTAKAPVARREQDGTQAAGWTVSRPLGGRISDIDPILTADEKCVQAKRDCRLKRQCADCGLQVLDPSILDFHTSIYHCRLFAPPPNSYHPRSQRPFQDRRD